LKLVSAGIGLVPRCFMDDAGKLRAVVLRAWSAGWPKKQSCCLESNQNHT